MSDIDAIKARLAAATPVFWTKERGYKRERGFVIIARQSAEYDTPTNGLVAWVGDFSHGREQAEKNADLIAHAPSDLAALVAEVERLTAEVAKLADPAAVHVNLLTGRIAKPEIRQMLHAYGAEALERWDAAHTLTAERDAIRAAAIEEAAKVADAAAAVERAEEMLFRAPPGGAHEWIARSAQRIAAAIRALTLKEQP